MWLLVNMPGAEPYPIPDRQALVEAVEAEAATIAMNAGCELLADPGDDEREALRKSTVKLLLSHLWRAGDYATAPDGAIYRLTDIASPASPL